LGNIIFGEILSLQWWFGASLIIIGTLLVNVKKDKGSWESKDKKQQ
jgi:drug/metabolite transporter (DMT)-like permease